MTTLYKDVLDIIYDYKFQLEHHDRHKQLMDDLKSNYFYTVLSSSSFAFIKLGPYHHKTKMSYFISDDTKVNVSIKYTYTRYWRHNYYDHEILI
jgi:hypothetical protein